MPFVTVGDRELLPGELRLLDALRAMIARFGLAGRVEDMHTTIKAQADALVPLLTERDLLARSDSGDGPIEHLLHETEAALREHVELKSRRAAKQQARFMLSARENQRGAPTKLNPTVVIALCETVEKIAGRTLSYGRWRAGKNADGVDSNKATTGAAEGEMLDVLLAAIDWAHFVAHPYEPQTAARRETVLNIVKRARRKPRQN